MFFQSILNIIRTLCKYLEINKIQVMDGIIVFKFEWIRKLRKTLTQKS